MCRFALTFISFVALAACTSADDSADNSPYNPYAKTLSDAQIEPTLAGVTQYLQTLIPSAAELERRETQVTELIKQLGDASYSRREEAMQRLITLPQVPRVRLEAAANSADPEIRWRSELVLKQIDRPDPVPEAVLRTIALLKIKGAAPVLLEVIPQLAAPHVRRAAAAALAASARREDAALLRTAMNDGEGVTQVAAITAFAAAVNQDARNELRLFLKSENIEVKLAAVQALANLGDRTVLPVLLELLAHDDVDIRASASNILRGLTGQQFGFIAYEEAKRRAVKVAAWRGWIADAGPTAKLNFPLPQHGANVEIGHTLILVYGKHQAIELNAAGETIWEKGDLQFPWAVQRLDNGNTLIGSYRGKYVVEFDQSGEEVWRKDGLPGGVFGLERLPNGNTLLGLHSAKKVIEINRAGETVWEATFNGQPMGVERLSNGNTVVALHSGNKVVEIDPTGKTVWEVGGLRIPRTVQRLSNGNTLVSDTGSNRAIELDHAGQTVWTYKAAGNVYDAQRLSNGSTLVSTTTGVVIVNDAGEIVWEKKVKGAGRAVRF